jgi:hypothetical protein
MTKKTSIKNKSCKTAKCATTKAKTYNVHTEEFNDGGLPVRYVRLNNSKHYFVSDLVDHWGRGFVDSMKTIIKLRIKHNNNSQERRLVSASELRTLKLA